MLALDTRVTKVLDKGSEFWPGIFLSDLMWCLVLTIVS